MSKFHNSHTDKLNVPSRLLKPLLFRGRESLEKNGIVYDPIAAIACQRCSLAKDCLSGNVSQKQLLHSTLTFSIDQQICRFLSHHPTAWIINVGAGLDTRFFRVDNGRCHWVELDANENLIWRKKLFHSSERYFYRKGGLKNLDWLDDLSIPDQSPVMFICENALLECDRAEVARFVQGMARRFEQAYACLVMAGDLTQSKVGKAMGSEYYVHGYSDISKEMLRVLPWAKKVSVISPFDQHCHRWAVWQRMIRLFSSLKYRLTPIIVQLRW
ncbi:class I SAM-dependent methyltransferase [Vibrio sp. S4M6]|uniref:class I SAM-dependent methyltransferase n=1 Tax=Vibrio sinus TaxID=2946865 RepID=UPI00202A64E5|nr:class I SAM-dependent methyltransferase [Vibrio sinus]MCL9783577.1 class I SAM-dependent methyltransferase [Vibrio sinus]